MKGTFLLVLSFLISFTVQEQAPENNIECSPEFPHFSAGDLNLTKDNYESFKAENKVFVLGLSDSDCKKCCYMEQMLDHLKRLLSTNFTYKGKAIPMARIDIKAARGAFASDLPTANYFPKILIYKNGKYYTYSSYMHYPLILYFFNRILYPYVQLNTTEEIDQFLDIDNEWPDWSAFYDYGNKYEEIGRDMLPQRLIRVIAFISSKEDYQEELKELKDSVQKLSPRDDFRFAFVFDKQVIKQMKTLHSSWFSQYSTSAIVMQRKRNDFVSFDIAAEDTNYFYWLTEYCLLDIP